MKIRTGFVSNSSSSSFLAFGKWINFEDIPECQSAEDPFGTADNILSDNNIPYWYVCDDEIFIGLSWDEVKDDETGLEFKKRALSTIQKLFPNIELEDLKTCEEAWTDN